MIEKSPKVLVQKAKMKIFVAVPIHRQWCHESFDMFSQAVKHSKYCHVDIVFKLYEESLIQRARNLCLKEFLKSKCDKMLFLDDDIILVKSNSIDLLGTAEGDIVSAPVVCKKPPYRPNFLPFGAEYPELRNARELIHVKYVSTSCTMYSRKVCSAVAKEHKYPFDCHEDAEGVYLSEDWAFCNRANNLDFKCMIDPKVETGHIGSYPFSIGDFYANMENGKNA